MTKKAPPLENVATTPARTRDEVLIEVFARVSGGESVSAVFRTRGMPNIRTFWRWVADDASVLTRYEAAFAMRGHAIAEEILDIADTCRIGEKRKTVQISQGRGVEVVKLPAEEVTTGDMVERAKLQVDARKWLLARMLPKKYGDKIEQTHVMGDETLAAMERASARVVSGK